MGSAGAEQTAHREAPFFGTAFIEDHATLAIPGSDGDLWPSCWSDEDALYTANGDGTVLGGPFTDIGVARITGSPFANPPNLAGVTLARGDQVGKIWTPGAFNRKPTGMFCADGLLYLAVQDLALDFMEAPAATIAVSRDKGRTWEYDRARPMFANRQLTTLMFLDYGKNNQHAIDDFAYVYALDDNWRFSTRVPSPTKLWLARVPKSRIQDRSAWTYFTGLGADGTPGWTADVNGRVAVLDDPTRIYKQPFDASFARDMTRLSQGSITYNPALKRYLYASWTEYTFELYEAAQPWGPWKHFLQRDYGVYPWSATLNGGYATTIPSKFISADGKTMFVQSNTFVGGPRNYHLSFRKLTVEPSSPAAATNPPGPQNLALRSNRAAPIFRAGHAGPTALLNDGATGGSIDSWTGEPKNEDFWGVTWPQPLTIDTIAYTTGKMFPDGGWFDSIRVQVRKDGGWVDIAAESASAYPTSAAAGTNQTYRFTFPATVTDGVRVIGAPGGARTFTSAAEIGAFFAAGSDPGPSPGPQTSFVHAWSDANVRSCPQTSCAKVDRVVAGVQYEAECWIPGQAVTNAGVTNDKWVRLRLGPSVTGYVSGVYLRGDETGGVTRRCE